MTRMVPIKLTAFDGQTPMQVLKRGGADRLWQMIH